ncbi:MAG: hypothetical protein CL546_07965 [Alcanivorax sp.]|nr:hypothetical protein [Alcanivorax sp.]
MTKQMSELIFRGVNQTVNETRSRLIAEEILLEYIKDWSRRLGMVSYGSVKTRESKGKELPRVGTFAWDFTAPSYISGLSDWANGAIKPGFFVCDLLLKDQVSQQDIEPFVNKIKTLKALRKIGRQFPVFVAGSYQLDAFKLLRENGVIPATVENLFGKETAESFKELMKVLMKAAEGVLNPEKLDELIGRLGKVEGAVRNMRGALFEFLVAEVIRKESPAEVEVSKILKAKSGSAEVDVWELKSGVVARAIECKGINPSGYVDEKEIDVWLRKRIIRVREYLDSIGWNGPKPRFELWTSGRLTDDSLERIKNTREANKNKFEIVAFDSMSVFGKIRKYNDKSLMAVYANNYCDAW